MGGYDIYILDTAGRLHIDQELIAQAAAVRDVANPRETLLVVDGLTGQDAVNVATEFDDKIGVSGVVLTRMDGDGRVAQPYQCVRSLANQYDLLVLAKK